MTSTMPVRCDVNSLSLARQAAAYRGVSVPEYISKIVGEAAARDIDEFVHNWDKMRKPIVEPGK